MDAEESFEADLARLKIIGWRDVPGEDLRLPIFYFADVLELEQMESEPPLAEETEELLLKLGSVITAIHLLQEESDRLVDQVREQGASWERIARAAGMKKQSAYQRWSENGREKHREYTRKRRGSSPAG